MKLLLLILLLHGLQLIYTIPVVDEPTSEEDSSDTCKVIIELSQTVTELLKENKRIKKQLHICQQEGK